MHKDTKTKAAGVGTEAAFEKKQQANNSSANPAQDILASKSTATEVQLAKTLAMLRTGPRTTVELREHGIMMPGPRIHYLRHVDGHQIETELITLYDANGFRHSKCARYHLIAEAQAQEGT